MEVQKKEGFFFKKLLGPTFKDHVYSLIFSKRGGFLDKKIKLIKDKIQKFGFKEVDNKDFHHPAYDIVTQQSIFKDKFNNSITFDIRYGETSYYNSFYITVRFGENMKLKEALIGQNDLNIINE